MRGTEGSEFCSAISDSGGVLKSTTLSRLWGGDGSMCPAEVGSESLTIFDMSFDAPGRKRLTPLSGHSLRPEAAWHHLHVSLFGRDCDGDAVS